jgi:hypothetical protein
MIPANLLEHIAGRPGPPARYILNALLNAFIRIRSSSDIKQALVGLGILDNDLGSSIDGEDHRTASVLQVLHRLGRLAPKVRQRLNVLGNVQHTSSIEHL